MSVEESLQPVSITRNLDTSHLVFLCQMFHFTDYLYNWYRDKKMVGVYLFYA